MITIPQFEPYISNKYIETVKKQMESSFVGCGKTVDTFENEISNRFNNRKVVTTNSGTSALLIASFFCKKNKKKKVIFPSYSFLAGLNAFVTNGFDYDLVDIKEDTLCMDPEKLEKKVNKSEDYSAVIFVNHNGYNGEDILQVKNICKKNNILFVEDSAQCFGIPKTGVSGDISILSFSVPKAITTGQGGAILTEDEEIHNFAKEIVDHGGRDWRKTKIHNSIGLNLRMCDINASFGLSQIDDWDFIEENRTRVWGEYRKRITIKEVENKWSWMVMHYADSEDQANRIIENLKKEGIQGVKYYTPIHYNPPFSKEKNFPVSERIYSRLVYLPSSIKLTEEEIDKICNIVIRSK